MINVTRLSTADDIDADNPGRVRTIDFPHSDDVIVITRNSGGLGGIGFELDVRERRVNGDQIEYRSTALPSIHVNRDRDGNANYSMSSTQGRIGDLSQLSVLLDIVAELIDEINNAE